jgi:hypothetical protein
MIETNSHAALAAYPPELIARVTDQATQDAEIVIVLLQAFSLAPPDGSERFFPAEFLLEVGAAARVLAWEVQGIAFSQGGVRLTAGDILLRVFEDTARRLRDPSAPAARFDLVDAVFRLNMERLAWTGPRDLQAEIMLDFPDEDALVESLAQILWDNRRRWSEQESESTS